MPGTDGYQLLQRLRTDPMRAHVPVVVVSSLGGDARTRSITGGAAAFLDKPVAAAELLDTVRRALD
jgi:two-component system cell cycle response regulator